jgi:hypothetical protein
MKLAKALFVLGALICFGCKQETKPMSNLEPYLRLPAGSSVRVILVSSSGELPAEGGMRTVPGSVRSGIFEGKLVSISPEIVVIQPRDARAPISFGNTVVREIVTVKTP